VVESQGRTLTPSRGAGCLSWILTSASIVFGVFIFLTSVLGIYFGTREMGLLAILYGLLGMSMGVAGIVAAWVEQPLRGALLGWFLVGIASRAIAETDVYSMYVSVPIAVLLLGAFVFEMARRPSAAGTRSALGGGALAILSLVALAFVSPYLPVICPTFGTEKYGFAIAYPASTYLFVGTESRIFVQCTG